MIDFFSQIFTLLSIQKIELPKNKAEHIYIFNAMCSSIEHYILYVLYSSHESS